MRHMLGTCCLDARSALWLCDWVKWCENKESREYGNHGEREERSMLVMKVLSSDPKRTPMDVCLHCKAWSPRQVWQSSRGILNRKQRFVIVSKCGRGRCRCGKPHVPVCLLPSSQEMGSAVDFSLLVLTPTTTPTHTGETRNASRRGTVTQALGREQREAPVISFPIQSRLCQTSPCLFFHLQKTSSPLTPQLLRDFRPPFYGDGELLVPHVGS